MTRTKEAIQQDIQQAAVEVQELRRDQRNSRDNDHLAIAKQIYRLTARLDALYAEKRAAQAPGRSALLLHVARQKKRKGTDEPVEQLFDTDRPNHALEAGEAGSGSSSRPDLKLLAASGIKSPA
jgi:hypothetical protein